MKKQGVSAIVATVLIILITTSSIVIIWTTILPTITDSLESTTGEKANLQILTEQGYTVYDPNTKMLKVQVSRGSDSLDVENIILQVVVDGETVESEEFPAPTPGQTKTYQINLSSYTGEITSVGVSYKEKGGRIYSESSETNKIAQGTFIPEEKPRDLTEFLEDLWFNWSFQNDQDFTVMDDSGKGNTGTYYGWVEDGPDYGSWYGTTLRLNGYGEGYGYGHGSWISTSSFPNLTNSFTFSIWVKPYSPYTPQIIEGTAILDYIDSYNKGFAILLFENRWYVQLLPWISQGYCGNLVMGSDPLEDQWQMITISYDSENEKVDCYLATTSEIVKNITWLNVDFLDDLSIEYALIGKGKDLEGIERNFTGSLDDIKMFETYLDSEEYEYFWTEEKNRKSS